ncbi:MAG: hypothetical protein WAK93_11535 [Solirubrobacteraceae bacterium]
MRSRRRLIPSIFIPVVTVSALAAAGCGGRSSPVATTTQNGLAALVAYSHCMRSHGVPNFPDPTRGEGIPKDEIPLGSPQFLVASRVCTHLMPATGLGGQETIESTRSRVAALLTFARCMRTHGVASFPDPTNQGQLTAQMVTAAGIDLHEPELLRAGLACVPVTHGLLTRGAIERAVNGG